MDPICNPYAPGAGSRPPELSGREDLINQVRIALERTRAGRSTKSILMVGLRGAGKTVLLDQFRDDAEANGIHTIRAEAPENKSLPALLAPQLRKELMRLSRTDQARDLAIRALRGLAGFVKALKVKYSDIEVGIDYDPEPGLADNGDLENDLMDLLEVSGEAAKKAGTALGLFIDELQYVDEDELAALITALHRCAQKRLPLVLVGAGLPQLRGRMGAAKSYAERLFDFPLIGPLCLEDVNDALSKPAAEQNVFFEAEAIKLIYEKTKGFPYFIQEWGKHVWDIALSSPITLHDVENASREVIIALDESFFRVRFDRLTPSEKLYLRGMAELGEGPHRSSEISEKMEKAVTRLAPVRASLIAKGMIWSPFHGDTAFTVPLFGEFMKRIMPFATA